MDTRSLRSRRFHIGCAISALAMLAGCGGGGGSAPPISSTPAPVPTPTPTPVPTPTPSPTPTPTPLSTFDTAEFRRSDGPGFHNATAAWTRGVTGKGAKIAIVDTGIDTDSPEFAGRIDPASADVAGNGTVEDVGGHGTQVALIAAAARNNTGIVGIAYDATIAMFRADTPGTCADTSAESDGCSFDDRDIATGINRAVSAGATVVNLSLGGDAPSTALINAVRNASAKGVVVVVSAGNDGDGSDPKIDPNQPNPFAAGVRNAGGSNVIIAGSVDENSQFSGFSNKAGSQAQWFLSALGERVCCEYENGALKIETTPDGQFVTLISGTSFSAPQIAGAVALLKQAFPNLTGPQMVELLLTSARDAGAAGTDSTYGRGILDIAKAFQPSGTTTLAGSATSVALGDSSGVSSGPMGDAFTSAPLGTVVLDGYKRAYSYDLARGLQRASVRPKLLGAVDADDEAEVPGPAGLDAGQRVLEDRRLMRSDAEAPRTLQERVRRRLALQAELCPDIAVHALLHVLGEAGDLEHLGRVVAARDDRAPQPGHLRRHEVAPRALVDLDPLGLDQVQHERVLLVPERRDLRLGRVHVAAGQEVADAVLARLAVDVAHVVLL